MAQKTKKDIKKQTEKGKVFISATFNNTIVTVTDEEGKTLKWSSTAIATGLMSSTINEERDEIIGYATSTTGNCLAYIKGNVFTDTKEVNGDVWVVQVKKYDTENGPDPYGQIADIRLSSSAATTINYDLTITMPRVSDDPDFNLDPLDISKDSDLDELDISDGDTNTNNNDNSNNDGSGSSGGGGGGGGSSLSSSNISNTSNLVSNVSSSSNDLIALGTDVIQTSSSDKDVENSSNQGRSFLTGAFIGVGDGLGFLGDLFLRILDWVKGLFG